MRYLFIYILHFTLVFPRLWSYADCRIGLTIDIHERERSDVETPTLDALDPVESRRQCSRLGCQSYTYWAYPAGTRCSMVRYCCRVGTVVLDELNKPVDWSMVIGDDSIANPRSMGGKPVMDEPTSLTVMESRLMVKVGGLDLGKVFRRSDMVVGFSAVVDNRGY